MAIRAATTDEMTYMARDGQRMRLGLVIHDPAVVYQARVNQTFPTTDGVTAVTYDGGSGTLANVAAGMTMWIGTSAGAWDAGMVRIRKAPTSTVFFIGETSEVAWADNLYLTIVEEYGLWEKKPLASGIDLWMDGETAYSSQHASFEPVAVMGPAAGVARLAGGTVDVTMSAGDSFCPGSSITGWTWSVSGGTIVSGQSTSTVTLRFTAAGTYWVKLVVTAANGLTATGRRAWFVLAENSLGSHDFELTGLRGSKEDGGWQFEVRVWNGLTAAQLRGRALAVLFAEEWYGTTKTSLGQVTGYENVVAVGYVDGESISTAPAATAGSGATSLRVMGAWWWLDRLNSSAMFLVNTTAAAARWTEMQSLTADKLAWHLAKWRSTMSEVMDVRLSGDTRTAGGFECEADSLWQKLATVGKSRFYGMAPCCDRYGRLFFELDTQMASATKVMTISREMWKGLEVEDAGERAEASQVIASGLDGTGLPFFAAAPGRPGRDAAQTELDRLVISDQADLNAIAGKVYGWLNHRFDLQMEMAQACRLVDICPRQTVGVTLPAADNPAGIGWTDKLFVVRGINTSLEGGFLADGWRLEALGTAISGVTVTRTGVGTPTTNPLPPFGGGWSFPLVPGTLPVVIPPTIPPEVVIPPGSSLCKDDLAAAANGPFKLFMGGNKDSGLLANLYGYLHATCRSSSHANKTRYAIDARFETKDPATGVWSEDSADDQYEMYLCSLDGTRVATATKDAYSGGRLRTGTLTSPGGAATQFYFAELAMDQQSVVTPSSVTVQKNMFSQFADVQNGVRFQLNTGTIYEAYWTTSGNGADNLVLSSASNLYVARIVNTHVLGNGTSYYGRFVLRFVFPSAPAGMRFQGSLDTNYPDVGWGWRMTGITSWTVGASFDITTPSSFSPTSIDITFDTNGAKVFGSSTSPLPWVTMNISISPDPLKRVFLSGAQLYNLCPWTDLV